MLFIQWNPSPDFIHITNNYSIKWYGMLWGLSLFSCFFLARYVFRKAGRDDEKITLIIQYVFIGGLIGARLAHIVFYNLDYYIANPLEVFEVWKGGLASHGGVIGGLAGLWFFCSRNKEYDFFWTLDHGIICVIMLAALVRLGNLMNSELYGKPSNLPWAFVFTRVDQVPRHPVVLYESICYMIIQAGMLWLYGKYRDNRPGIYLSVFLVAVFGVRFILEFTKTPDGDMILGLISKTQALDLPFIMGGIALGWLALKNKLHYHGVSVTTTHGKV